jgi:hypothetical protein
LPTALGREIFYIELWHFAALLVILGVNSWFYRNAEKNSLLYRYLMLQGALLLWVVSKMLESVAPTEALRWLAIVSQYLGVSFLGPLFFLFVWRYVYGRDAGLRTRLLLYVPSLFFFMVMATNPQHHLFYAAYNPLFMTCSFAFFGLAVFRSRFLGVLPAAWKSLLMDLEDPLILTDRGSKQPDGRCRGAAAGVRRCCGRPGRRGFQRLGSGQRDDGEIQISLYDGIIKI